MNPPTQSPPPSHQAHRRRIARDLIGLFLVGAGAAGLLGALYAANPLAALFLAGLTLTAGGATILRISSPLPRIARFLAGYFALTLGLTILVGIACHLTPWSLLFALMLTLGVLLSSEGA
ncbi:hypothetical protein ACWDZ4_20485 [Streptomyces sp. NPDC003016]